MGNNNIIKVNYTKIESSKKILENEIKNINSLQQKIQQYSRLQNYGMVYEQVINSNSNFNNICDNLNNNCKYLDNVLRSVDETNHRIKTYNSISFIDEFNTSVFNLKNLVKVSGETGTIAKIGSAILGPMLKIDEEKFGKIDGVVIGGSAFLGVGKVALSWHKNRALKKAIKESKKIWFNANNIRKSNNKKALIKKIVSGSSVRYMAPKGFKIGLKYAKEDFKTGFSKLKWGKTGADHLGAAFAWGGILIDGISNFKNNKEEYGEVSGRMLAETVTETAVGFVIDTAIHAAVAGAVAGVVGVAAAGSLPAVIGIAAGTILVKSVGDAIVKKVTGDKNASMTEVASDFILDSSSKIFGGMVKVTETVGGVGATLGKKARLAFAT